ncbi:MAG: nitrophenyl compound nitroreductase subunit ArsF family protein [Bacteroidota bacterium]|nr:nitrophenyl compound nitroreductase subunit ArsF family protein [Bacteroidota bacterium]
MKKFLFILVLFISGIFAANAQSGTKPSGVEVYYFHSTNRCATCMAVEAVTKEALKQYYGDQITLKSINREEDTNNPLIKKHQISRQTLLVLKGVKTVNLTNDAFMYARTNPDKLKAKIKETIEKM